MHITLSDSDSLPASLLHIFSTKDGSFNWKKWSLNDHVEHCQAGQHQRQHYPPRQPAGPRSMSKIGTWFLMVHVTSLDRTWPKLNLPSGAFGEKWIFACLRGLLAIFLLERSILFFRQSLESDNKSFGHKKNGCHTSGNGYWTSKTLKSCFLGQIPTFWWGTPTFS